MFKAVAIFNRHKNARRFKDYYGHWFSTLKNNLLPLLRRSLSRPDSPTVLSTHVDLLHQHFQALYHALDLAASNEDDIAVLLFPDWRSSLEKPLIWLGDLHPYLFTNLVRCFLQEDDDLTTTTTSDDGYFIRNNNMTVTDLHQDRPWQVAMAWRNPSEELVARMDEIELGLRAMVPILTTRMRNAEAVFVDRVVEGWYPCRGRKGAATKMAVGSILTGHMEDLMSIFLDANRLRRSVIGEIVGKTSVYQAALFLEALAQFLIEFREQELVSAVEWFKASSSTTQTTTITTTDARHRHH
ncbi:protein INAPERTURATE POLLEN1 [Prosopis cineraria]|uniref:protein INAPERTURATE POLLEN1 n=1 Tax=Prosopis cineraria TaxID=364024 RepID=UPI0024104A02|nr:protein INAPERTURATE POLLEN1 [Prosopis cineraria]